jgi:sterol desaturase/sphingolipid hydroxylase (fatty acid hydroxylase superfamily)
LVCFVAGLAAWPFVEYLVHGVLSHRLHTPISKMHASHHRDVRCVFTPRSAAAGVATLLFLGLWPVLGPLQAGASVAGLVVAFIRYEWVHYAIHFRTPRDARETLRRQHHFAHHYVNPGAYFGVTNRFTDKLFGSLPPTWRHDYTATKGRMPG